MRSHRSGTTLRERERLLHRDDGGHVGDRREDRPDAVRPPGDPQRLHARDAVDEHVADHDGGEAEHHLGRERGEVDADVVRARRPGGEQAEHQHRAEYRPGVGERIQPAVDVGALGHEVGDPRDHLRERHEQRHEVERREEQHRHDRERHRARYAGADLELGAHRQRREQHQRDDRAEVQCAVVRRNQNGDDGGCAQDRRPPSPQPPHARVRASAAACALGPRRPIPLGPSHVFFRQMICHSLTGLPVCIPAGAENSSIIEIVGRPRARRRGSASRP